MQNYNKWLTVNGCKRLVIYGRTDTLATVLRRLGLTGVKVGCGVGQCGACTVLLDGKPVRSCTLLMNKLPESCSIVTIEGIGTPDHLHPLQQAWIICGSVQCGFCSPGFIVAAKGLLDTNPSPTREDVRTWFQKNHNICRCTGYKPLVDAVMLAASALRGEVDLSERVTPTTGGKSIYGTRYPKPTAMSKVTGLCDYGDDIGQKMPEGTLHLAVVMPKSSHARILGIDVGEAEAMPGVVKVVTAKDVQGTNRATIPQSHARASCDGSTTKPILCDEKIVRYGDVVAVVAAYTREQARAAAEQVKVELEELPVYRNALEAFVPGAERIHEETPNLYCYSRVIKGEDTKTIFETAPHVVSGSFSTQREPHLVLEPDTMQAYWDEQGKMTVHCKSQNIFGTRAQIAAGIGLPVERIRIIENPTGATFGYGMSPSGPALVAVCAMCLNRPVTLTFSYPEHQAFTGKRAASFINARLACDEAGKIQALEYDLTLDHGGYPETGAKLMDKCCRFLGWPYQVPNVRGLLRAGLSNNAFGIMYRAFGSPQAYAASEALMDMMAEELRMDRLAFRKLNIAREGDLTVNSTPYHEYLMPEMLEDFEPYYHKALKEVHSCDTETVKHGIGLVCGGYHVGLTHDTVEVAIGLNPDGSVTHYSSWEQQGQGADIGALTHAIEALAPLHLEPSQIHLVMNDTEKVPNSGPASGSKSHYMIGLASLDAAGKLLSAMRKSDGSYRTYQEMVAEDIPTRYMGKHSTNDYTTMLDVDNGRGQPAPGANYMIVMAEVAVDVPTGKTKVLWIKNMTDIGVIGNQLAVEGQAYGGLSHCVGFALTEDYSDLKKHAYPYGAGIPRIEDIPDDMELIFRSTPRPKGPYGSGGCSEGFQSVAHMAVVNGIYDAVGVRIHELPATGEKIRAALAAKAVGNVDAPGPYDFGTSMDELWRYMDEHPVKK